MICYPVMLTEWLFQIQPPSILTKIKTISGMIMLVGKNGMHLLEDSLFPEAIEANKSRMEEVMKKVESVRGITSASGGQNPQTSKNDSKLWCRPLEECCGISAWTAWTEKGTGETHDNIEGLVMREHLTSSCDGTDQWTRNTELLRYGE